MPASTVIQIRRGTAAQWSSANPILAQGEMGYETDSGQFKIGDGTSNWASLSYSGLSGPQSSSVLESLGDGSDGNVSVSSGVTTLVRDMFYNNLTISGTGQINMAGFKIFVKGTLDITAAPVAAIFSNGGNGTSAASATGGAVGAAAVGVTVGGATAGTAGATGVAGAGAQATAPTAGNSANGGASGAGGAGGNGMTGAVVVDAGGVS